MTEEGKMAKARGLEKELEEEWEKIRPILEKITPEEVAQSIREDRDSR